MKEKNCVGVLKALVVVADAANASAEEDCLLVSVSS